MAKLTNDWEIESDRTYVVYDEKTGRIAHVHQVTTYAGAKAASERADKAEALKLAKQFGHSVRGLRVLNVRARDLNLGVPQRVDVKTRRLVRFKLPPPTSA